MLSAVQAKGSYFVKIMSWAYFQIDRERYCGRKKCTNWHAKWIVFLTFMRSAIFCVGDVYFNSKKNNISFIKIATYVQYFHFLPKCDDCTADIFFIWSTLCCKRYTFKNYFFIFCHNRFMFFFVWILHYSMLLQSHYASGENMSLTGNLKSN